MFKAIVNNTTELTIDTIKDETTLNGKPINWDIVRINERQFHIIDDNKSYEVELIKKDEALKQYELKINSRIYKVNIKDNADLLLTKLGINVNAIDTKKEIKAPMPGLIFNILVSEGQEVKKGDPLLILEAMKMENVLKSPNDGIIKSIKVAKGASVEKNQILIQF